MKKSTVCKIANALHKAGKSLSEAFKTAWKLVKNQFSYKTSVAGTSFRQPIISYFSRLGEKNCMVEIRRDSSNAYDANAVMVRMGAYIGGKFNAGQIGFIPKELAKDIAQILDAGVKLHASLKAINGGYSGKNFGVSVEITL